MYKKRKLEQLAHNLVIQLSQYQHEFPSSCNTPLYLSIWNNPPHIHFIKTGDLPKTLQQAIFPGSNLK